MLQDRQVLIVSTEANIPRKVRDIIHEEMSEVFKTGIKHIQVIMKLQGIRSSSEIDIYTKTILRFIINCKTQLSLINYILA